MPNFGSIVQKAFYLGIGLASVASEKAGTSIGELRLQAQKLAEELVERGEMTTEEARKLVDELVQQAQKPEAQPTATTAPPNEPRRIEILNDDEPETSSNSSTDANDIDSMEQKVKAMQEELRRLQRN
ncbi:MAG: hypothetical protein HC916_12515 [Coleofasciculaceae cyanobacterium SM2_1_6]|nr:hypothetical protein [Coleofasciculaceae cyanobacterium SM2_1_6]